jgi:hypothetical protein
MDYDIIFYVYYYKLFNNKEKLICGLYIKKYD